MNETRAIGQEIQDQVLAAARKGQQRVTSTVKSVTATAQLIRPQLPSLPSRPSLSRPTLNVPGLPTPAQLRERAPQLSAMVPSTEQLRAGAHEFAEQFLSVQRKVIDQVRSASAPLAHQADAHDLAGQFLSVQRKVIDQVRSVTTPLAHQAAAVFTQVSRSAGKATAPAALSDDTVTEHGKADAGKADAGKAGSSKAEHGKAEHDKAEHRRDASSKADASKADAQHDGPSARKPRTRSTAK
jgi:hypothetical protein